MTDKSKEQILKEMADYRANTPKMSLEGLRTLKRKWERDNYNWPGMEDKRPDHLKDPE